MADDIRIAPNSPCWCDGDQTTGGHWHPSRVIEFNTTTTVERVFKAHEMRILCLGLVPPHAFLVTCICGDAQRVEWFNRDDPDTPLSERITAAYRTHLEDTP